MAQSTGKKKFCQITCLFLLLQLMYYPDENQVTSFKYRATYFLNKKSKIYNVI